MTGHYPPRYMLKKINENSVNPRSVIPTDTCRFCESGKENMEHILCHCDALDIRRFTYFDRFKLEPKNFYELDVRKVSTFLDSLKIR